MRILLLVIIGGLVWAVWNGYLSLNINWGGGFNVPTNPFIEGQQFYSDGMKDVVGFGNDVKRVIKTEYSAYSDWVERKNASSIYQPVKERLPQTVNEYQAYPYDPERVDAEAALADEYSMRSVSGSDVVFTITPKEEEPTRTSTSSCPAGMFVSMGEVRGVSGEKYWCDKGCQYERGFSSSFNAGWVSTGSKCKETQSGRAEKVAATKPEFVFIVTQADAERQLASNANTDAAKPIKDAPRCEAGKILENAAGAEFSDVMTDDDASNNKDAAPASAKVACNDGCLLVPENARTRCGRAGTDKYGKCVLYGDWRYTGKTCNLE